MHPSPKDELKPASKYRSLNLPKWKNTFLCLIAVLLFIGMVGLIGLIFVPAKSPKHELLGDITIPFHVIPTLLVAICILTLRYEVEPDTLSNLNQELARRVQLMAKRMDMNPPRSRVLYRMRNGHFGASMAISRIGVTVSSMEVLSSDELDFVIARELSHLRLRHGLKMLLFVFLPIPLLCFLSLYVLHELRHHEVIRSTVLNFIVIVLSQAVFLGPISVLMPRLVRRHEFESDRMALETTGDLAVALATIKKTSPFFFLPEPTTEVKARMDALTRTT